MQSGLVELRTKTKPKPLKANELGIHLLRHCGNGIEVRFHEMANVKFVNMSFPWKLLDRDPWTSGSQSEGIGNKEKSG